MAIFHDCRDCKKYEGNCGHHFVDFYGHIHYDIPNETYMDDSIGDYGSCFEPSEEYLQERASERVKYIASNYSLKDIETALEILKEGDPK